MARPSSFSGLSVACIMLMIVLMANNNRRRRAIQNSAPPPQKTLVLESKALENAHLVALAVRQTKEVETLPETLTAHLGASYVLVSSFTFETNPGVETSVELSELTLQILEDGIVLRDLELEVDGFNRVGVGLAIQADKTQKLHFYGLQENRKRFGANKRFYVNLYATIDKSSREGTYTIPLRLIDWRASDRGKQIPFPGAVNGCPIVVCP